MLGFTAKIVGCFGFIAVYALYYGYGDTFGYFEAATELRRILIQDPGRIISTISATALDSSSHGNMGIRFFDSSYINPSNYTVVRFTLLFGILTYNSYIAASLLFAFSSFIGIWALYRVVAHIFPDHYTAVTIPILYIPSVFFWGSSMMKDSIVIGFLGLLTYGIYWLFFQKKKLFLSFLFVLFSVYILSNVKQYVIIAYAPALVVWLSLGPLNRLPVKERWIAMPFLLLAGIIIIGGLFPFLEKASQRYTIEQVLETAETTANYIHRTTPEGGSGYTLGEVSYTPLGMLVVFPRAVTVTLFQPFLYEVRNPVMLLSAIESLVFLMGTIFILFKLGLFRFISNVMNHPFLLMCLVFSVFFAFAIGISTYNYGSLVRYKIPCLPFYGIALILPYMIWRAKRHT